MSRGEIVLQFEVELAEDTHTGTGVGRLGVIDVTQSRDGNDRPVVWFTTVRGLLREAGEDLLLNRRLAGLPDDQLAAQRKLLYELLGPPVNSTVSSRNAGCCRVRSWYLARPDEQIADTCMTVSSTARKAFTRQPEDKTLRTIELARSGLTFDGEVRLPAGDASPENDPRVALLTGCLKRLTRIGSRKTRGQGRIVVRGRPPRLLEAPSESESAVQADGPVRIRLLLQNLEPLLLTRTASSGNLNPSLACLPGTSLRGALLHWISESDQATADMLADPHRMQVATGCIIRGTDDASPVKGTASGRLWELQSIPAPLTLRAPKSGTRMANGAAASQTGTLLPWWAGDADDRLGSHAETDAVALAESDPSTEPAESLKRLRAESWLVRSEDWWRRVRPKLGVMLRNRVPTARRDPDSRVNREEERQAGRHNSNDDPGSQADALFNDEVLWENQLFLSELTFADADSARGFLQATAFLWQPPETEDRSWLRVGRGGRPVVVCGIDLQQPSGASEPSEPEPATNLVLTLTSELIARGRTLEFLTRLTVTDLISLVSRSIDAWNLPVRLPSSTEGLCIDDGLSVYESTEVRGFNSASGLPRAAALAFRRGSVFRLTVSPDATDNADAQRRLGEIHTALSMLEELGVGLGERRGDGFGRFCLNLDVHSAGSWQAVEAEIGDAGTEEKVLLPDPQELVLRRVTEVASSLLTRSPRELPSISQWQWLRGQAQTWKQTDDIAAMWRDVFDRRAGSQWQEVHSRIDHLIEESRQAGDIETCRLLVLRLASRAVADIRRRGAKGVAQ